MKPIETSTTNAVYTLEGCYDLPVTKYINVNKLFKVFKVCSR